MPPEFGTAIEEFAPFLSRISALAKYSKKMMMNCMTQPLGKLYLRWLEKVVCLFSIGVVVVVVVVVVVCLIFVSVGT